MGTLIGENPYCCYLRFSRPQQDLIFLTRIQRNKSPPLDHEVEGVFVEEEEVVEEEVHSAENMTSEGKGYTD